MTKCCVDHPGFLWNAHLLSFIWNVIFWLSKQNACSKQTVPVCSTWSCAKCTTELFGGKNLMWIARGLKLQLHFFLPQVIHFSCMSSCSYSNSLLCWRLLWNLRWIWMLLSHCRDDHGFSPLHWACREGRSSVVDMLIMRGARINVMNRGDDTPLHLAASHGHRDIVGKVRFM